MRADEDFLAMMDLLMEHDFNVHWFNVSSDAAEAAINTFTVEMEVTRTECPDSPEEHTVRSYDIGQSDEGDS